MSILNASWLTPLAKAELEEIQRKDVNSFNFFKRYYQMWPSPTTPTKVFIYHVSLHGLLETFKAMHFNLALGINGEGALNLPPVDNFLASTSPLLSASSGVSAFKNPTLPFIEWLLDNGADIGHLESDNSFFHENFRTARSVLHKAVMSVPALTLLFQRGAKVTQGSVIDPRLGDLNPISLVSCWCEQTPGVPFKKSLPALHLLYKNGLDFNESVSGSRFADCKQNVLCHFWSLYDFNRILPDILSWGVDAHQTGPDGYSLYTLVLENATLGKGKVKRRAETFLDYLDVNYPPPYPVAPPQKMGP